MYTYSFIAPHHIQTHYVFLGFPGEQGKIDVEEKRGKREQNTIAFISCT